MIEHIKNISILLLPIIPIASNKVLDILNVDQGKRNLASINNQNILNHKKQILKTTILFKKINEKN